MPRLPDQFLRDLRDRVDIVAVVGEYVDLRKRGGGLWARCPIHNEKTPSLKVNPLAGLWYCFGCKANGDAIDWVTKVGGLSFRDAVDDLAGRCGLTVPTDDDDPDAARRAAEQRRSLELLERAATWYAGNLSGSLGAEELRRRGVSPEIAAAARLGWAPEDHGAMLSDTSAEDLIAAGLFGRSTEGGRLYPVFGGRLVFPIIDARGRVIGFGGRDQTGKSRAKYVNGTETAVYRKDRALYGLDVAQRAGMAAGRVVVVEGYFDVLALRAAGVPWAVAPCGTAVTQGHWATLRRITSRPTLCLDGDAAGKRATFRSLLGAVKAGCQPTLAVLPAGLDPDDLMRRDGPQALLDVLDKPAPAVRVWLDDVARRLGTTPTEAVAEAAEVLRETPPADRVQWCRYLAQRLGVDLRVVSYGIEGPRKALPATTAAGTAGQDDGPPAPPSLASLVRIAVQCPDVVPVALESGLTLPDSAAQGLGALPGCQDMAGRVEALSGALRACGAAGAADPVPEAAVAVEAKRALLALVVEQYEPAEGLDVYQLAKAQAMQAWASQEVERIGRCLQRT